MEERPILSNVEKVALSTAGDTTSRIMTMDGTTAEDIIKERNTRKYNDLVDSYVEKLNEHAANLEDYTEQIAKNVENIEIMPIGIQLLVKQFEENPFQRIVKDNKTGLILDLGGQRPQYKNTDNGEIEEEENFIKVAVVQEVGPECKYVKPGDTIFTTKPSLVPVPFYKQNLYVVPENRIMAIVNEGLTKRFEEIKKL